MQIPYRNVFLFIYIIIHLISCNSKKNDNVVIKRIDSVQLIPSKEIKFKLDSVTQQINPAISYFNVKDSFLAVFNEYNSTVYFYDFTSKQANYKTIIQKEGPDGIGKGSIKGLFFKSLDSLIIETDDFNIHILSKQGKRLKTINLNPFIAEKSRSFKNIHVSFPGYTYSPDLHFILNDTLYLTGSMDDSWNNKNASKSGVLIKVNLTDEKITYSVPYPEMYENGLWTIYYRYVFATCNPNNRNFVFSFPADHFLYVTNYGGDLEKKVFANSKYVETNIQPASSSKGTILDMDKRDRHYFENLAYRYIYYDIYRKVYYRFAELPVKDYKRREESFKQYSIIILNEKLEIIGETLLPKGRIYIPVVMFISKDGLNILKIDKNNEEEMTFTTFSLDKK